MSFGAGGAALPFSYRPSPDASNSRPDQPFDFNVPPRLAKIGRRISQMSENFLPPDNDPSSRRASQIVDVPGMGDEPVMCPFCSKPLPPALFAGHHHTPRRSMATPHTPIAEARLPVTAMAISPAVAQAQNLLGPLPITQEITPTAESLASTVESAESTETIAVKSTISPDDLKRWSRLAGILVDSVEPVESDKDIPLLPPLPPNQRSTSASSRFGFFRKGAKTPKEEDEESEEEGGGTGYAKLIGSGSPSDDEATSDEPKSSHAEPKTEEPSEIESQTEPALVEAEVRDKDLRAVLKEILGKVTEMSQSQTSLVTSHASLLTLLKISKSNLAMAQANSDMLEQQLKRTRATPQVPSATTPVTPNPAVKPTAPLVAVASARTNLPVRGASSTNTVKASPDVTRLSLDESRRIAAAASVPPRRTGEQKPRPMSLQLPPMDPAVSGPATATGAESKGGFNFWTGGKKKLPGGLGTVNIPSPAQVMASLPGSPAGERSGFDFHSLGMTNDVSAPPNVARSNTEAGRPAFNDDGLARSMSHSTLPNLAMAPTVRTNSTSKPVVSSQASELYRLRQSQAAAQGRMESMSKELAELKKGKVEMEAELENLSQALFEEANKMVADERRKRAEVEENLKEVREEREALRDTIKVLGGNVEEEAEKKDDFDLASFEPRDLDKHYEALRKTIHHVADGTDEAEAEGPALEGLAATTLAQDTGDAQKIGISPNIPASLQSTFDLNASASGATLIESTFYDAPPAAGPPLDPNPWSAASEPESVQMALGVMDEAVDGKGEGQKSPAEDLDRMMAKLYADKEEE